MSERDRARERQIESNSRCIQRDGRQIAIDMGGDERGTDSKIYAGASDGYVSHAESE